MKGLEGVVANALQNVMANMVQRSGVEETANNFVLQLRGRFDRLEEARELHAKLDLILNAQAAIAQRLDVIEERLEKVSIDGK